MNNEKVLIVEDEKIIALDLQRRLERFGYQVCDLAVDGAEAIEKAKTHLPDIILMDIMLSGGMDGIEAARRIKNDLKIPIIFLTAYADEKTLERAKETEPVAYILKPFKERELFTTIEIALYKVDIDKKLKKQERLFSSILHSVNDGIIATDMNLIIQFMNPVAVDITGWPEHEAHGRHLTAVLPITDARSDENILASNLPEHERPFFFGDMLVKNRLNDVIYVDGSITRINERENETEGYVVALRDITEFKRMSATIDYQASHDSLTGLSNREEFSYKLQELIRTMRDDTSHGLLTMDIDRFKVINDTCGSMAGDELLRQVSNTIQSLVQKSDISARVGGDEFAIILLNCDIDNSLIVAQRLQEAVRAHKFIWQNSFFPITLSIGVVTLSKQIGDIRQILAAADDACYLSKEEGGDRINIFQSSDNKYQKRRGEMEWIGKINRALQENQFRLYYQPIKPLIERADIIEKVEILLRMVSETGAIIKPMDFIPAAERYNLMPSIDRWVVENTISEYRNLLDAKSPLSDRVFTINLSGPSLLDESLANFIIFTIDRFELSSDHFCFEVTETAAIQNLSYASRFMKRLKERGFTFALDDFGSGFSSFTYLSNLPVDYLKIDGAFVQNIDESLVSYTMVESINSMGHVLGLQTIGEYVKNKAILEKLRAMGVDYAQGYEISEPKPLRS
jgi:diguanylate cyclase (GGDEF)-like protein/PAS domain S-box-containing protein